MLGTQRCGSIRLVVVYSAVLAACVGLLGYIVMSPGPPAPAAAVSPPPAPAPAKQDPAVIARFFDDRVQPALAAADAANREAAKRCLERLRDLFNTYRDGIAPFADDMTSWGTRFGVLRRIPSDWWNERTGVQDMIAAKFETHLFSEQSLQGGIEEAISKFRDDVKANQAALLRSVQAAVSSSDLPGIAVPDYSTFSSDVTKSLKRYAADSAVDSLSQLMLTELASGVAGAVATQLTVAIATRIAAMAAASSAAAGGATAGGTAAGGGGGSAAGPVGTVVGAAVGLVIGLAIDLWMTKRFERKLSGQLAEMIDEIEASVIAGSADKPGVERSLDDACNALRSACRQSLFDRIVGEHGERGA